MDHKELASDTPASYWWKLSAVGRVMNYFPGITREQSQRGYYKNIVVYCPLFGLTGAGKSAFVESCEHIFGGRPTSNFYRQGSGGGESFTPCSVEIFVNQYLRLVDTEGFKAIAPEQFGQYLQKKTTKEPAFASDSHLELFLHQLKNYLPNSGKQEPTKIAFHCPIFVWEHGRLDEISRLQPFVSGFKGITKIDPVVVISKADDILALKKMDIKEFQKQYQQIRRDVQITLGAGVVHLVQSYQPADLDDTAIDENISSVLADVLQISDELVYRAAKGDFELNPISLTKK